MNRATVAIVILLGSLGLSDSIVAQTCPQPVVLRQESCTGGAQTCSTKGSTLTFQELDRDIINSEALCDTVGLFTWPAPGSGFLMSDISGVVSRVSASGVGSCTNQVVTGVNNNAAPTCSSVTSAMITNATIDSVDMSASPSGTLATAWIPTLNQNTTGSAAKWTTARSLAGNSVDGSANVTFSNAFIVKGTSDAGLSNAQFLGALSTGIVKVTTTTGTLSTAAVGDFPTLNQNTSGSAASLSATNDVAHGGTNLASAADDAIMLGNGTTWQSKTIPDCQDSTGNHLNYTQSTNTLSCGVSTVANPVYLYKSADQSVNNSATMVSATDLSATLTASHKYSVSILLNFDDNSLASSGGVRVQIGGTATYTNFILQVNFTGNGVGSVAQDRLTAASAPTSGTSSTVPMFVSLDGTVAISAGGTFILQFAQESATIGNTTLLKGSLVIIRDLG